VPGDRLNFVLLAAANIFLSGLITFAFLPQRAVIEKKTQSIAANQSVESATAKTVETRVVMGGDVMLGRSVMSRTLQSGDAGFPFRYIANMLNSADVAFVNLENPVINDCPVHDTGYLFCSPPMMLEGLKSSGVDVVSLANNHSMNYGTNGYAETKKYLEDLGIMYAEGNPAVLEKNGLKFVFLALDLTVRQLDEEILFQVARADTSADILVVSLHWGVEYEAEPRQYQRNWAGKLIDAGADVIVGHHPHWLQTIEYIKQKPVFYSLGNLIFDQMWSEETKKGVLIELVFSDGELREIIKHPTYMTDLGQPRLVDGIDPD
jgi:poly-gamma-glutamate capsule biosynthesis protein CapA/YwtB (metallophosphatase superfamily)